MKQNILINKNYKYTQKIKVSNDIYLPIIIDIGNDDAFMMARFVSFISIEMTRDKKINQCRSFVAFTFHLPNKCTYQK